MADRPILFSAPMIQAILAGRKTVTRRILKPQPRIRPEIEDGWWVVYDGDQIAGRQRARFAEGDRLWVRETWAHIPASAYRLSEGVFQMSDPNDPDMAAIYAASWARSKPTWKVSIHMPRWASRITLHVTAVKIERLQEISEEDAEAEGAAWCETCRNVGWLNNGPDGGEQCPAAHCGDASIDQFRRLWESINGAGSWAENPWVAAISFRPVLANIDSAEDRAA